ncbi:MAG TPA: Ku protein [Pseudonocardiaceae bacterium]|nr:Ku protein [Pseudonocardiaceae bacterium]
MRSMWKGAVSFGLVSIPIHLYTATENHNVSFRQVHAADGGRVQYKRVCTVDGEEVPYAEIAKGYETPEGEMVVLTDADLADLPLPSQRGIEVVEFVPLEAIDPICFDRSYYLEPQKPAVKPYVLLRDALQKSGHVAIAQVVLRQREALAVLRVYADMLVLTTMLWPDEVRTPDFAFLREETPQVRQQEMAMAGSLIDSMSDTVFDPDKYQDHYQQALQALVDAKIAGDEVRKPAAKSADEPTDLVSALRASLAGAKKSAPAKKPAEKSGTEKSSAAKAAPKTTAAKTPAKPAAKTGATKATPAKPAARRPRKSA